MKAEETKSNQPQGKLGQFFKKLRKINKTTVLGAVMFLFAAIGLVVSIVFVSGRIAGALSHDKEKQLYESILTPVVMLDPAPVENMSKLGNEKIVSAAIWNLILNEDKNKYDHDDYSVYIPVADVDFHAKKLFGTDIQFSNVSVGDSEYTFEYISDTKMYSVPIELQYLSYKPQIEKITKTGDKLALRVGYIPQGSSWGKNLGGNYEDKPFKYVEYELTKTGREEYIISGIRETKEDGSSGVTSGATSSSPASSAGESQTDDDGTSEPVTSSTSSDDTTSQTPTNVPVTSEPPAEEATAG